MHQHGRRVVLHENSSNSFPNHSRHVSIVHTRCDKQHFSFEVNFVKLFEKVSSLFRSKIEIQQDHVNSARLEYFYAFDKGTTIRDNFKPWLRLKQSSETLAKQRVIINEEQTDVVCCWHAHLGASPALMNRVRLTA